MKASVQPTFGYLPCKCKILLRTSLYTLSFLFYSVVSHIHVAACELLYVSCPSAGCTTVATGHVAAAWPEGDPPPPHCKPRGARIKSWWQRGWVICPRATCGVCSFFSLNLAFNTQFYWWAFVIVPTQTPRIGICIVSTVLLMDMNNSLPKQF